MALTKLIFARDLQWVFRELLVKDVGIDAHVEIVSSGSATGNLLAVQIKSGDSYFSESTADGVVFRGNSQHLEYWLRYPLPVFVVLCRPNQNRCWWQLIDSDRVTLTGKGWKTVVPFTNELGPTSADSIRTQVHDWRAQRQERDRPAEDEFSVILQWLGRCRLVHKLHQFAFPPGPHQQFSIPALVAAFEVNHTTIPVLIDVADCSLGGKPSWEASQVDSLQRYANLLSMPLLIALKYLNVWTLFEARHLRRAGDKLEISFSDAMSETLLGVLAGDFSFSFYPGVGMHLKIRKDIGTPGGGFDGLIEEAYLLNDNGERHSGAGGIFQLFACMESEAQLEEDETHAVQSFVIAAPDYAEWAHRALATMLSTFAKRPLDWHQILRRQLPLPMSPREAVRNGAEAGFIRHTITIRPKTIPAFLSGKLPHVLEGGQVKGTRDDDGSL